MSGNVSFNPYATSSPQNSFLLESQGLVQGLTYSDTVSRLWLKSGVLASTETIVMWGGVPIEEPILSTGTGAEGIGPNIKRATSQATVTGFSTGDQMNSMVIVPGNSAPVSGIGGVVGFYRLGTNARLAVQADPALVSAVSSGNPAINSQALYWDVTNYRVTLTTTGGNFALPTSIRLLETNTNSKIINYASGVASWTQGDAVILLI